MIPADDYFKVKIAEMLKPGVQWDKLPIDIQNNLVELRASVNVIRKAYNKPMVPTSGLRTMKDHLRIYRNKGITDKRKIPMKSKHLYGQAVDIYDPKQELQKFLLKNEHLLRDCDLWCEDFRYTSNGRSSWVHFQTSPYGSWRPGKSRFFIP